MCFDRLRNQGQVLEEVYLLYGKAGVGRKLMES
jgi:hypothetical protein